MNHSLGVVVIGAKIKRLGASLIGAKLLAYVGVDAKLEVTSPIVLALSMAPRRQAHILTLTPLNFGMIFTMRWTYGNFAKILYVHLIVKLGSKSC
jgi:hypothetical protein